MTARNLFEYHKLTLTKSVLRYNQPKILRELFIRVEHDHTTRQTGQLRLPRISSEAGKRRIAYGGAKAYNDLPTHMRETPRMSSFKADLTAMLK